MMPEPWNFEQLEDVAAVIDCKHRTPKYVESGIPVMSPGSISWGKLDLDSPTKRVTIDDYASLMDHCDPQCGDLVMSRNQSIGVASYVSSREPFVLGQDTILIQCQRDQGSPKFAFFAIQSEVVQRQIYRLSGGSTFSRINLRDIRKLKIPFPKIAEQAQIAGILSTWDQAIETNEKLIENSKVQKKALMRQLLTGKKRLPGFSDEWSESILKNIAAILVSPVNKKSVAGEPSVRLCNYTDVYYNSHISNNLDFMTATASNSEVKRFTLKKNDLIITKDSETPEDIAVPALVSEELDNVVCGYHLAIIRPDTKIVEGAFLNHLFSQPKVRYYFSTRANGATRFGLTIDGIKEASFMLPGIDEQQKIASVLDACDRELRYLSIVAQKLTIEKRALMQQLLTGKRRVKVAA